MGLTVKCFVPSSMMGLVTQGGQYVDISHRNHPQSTPICCWSHQPDYQYNCLPVVAALSPTVKSCNQHIFHCNGVTS